MSSTRIQTTSATNDDPKSSNSTNLGKPEVEPELVRVQPSTNPDVEISSTLHMLEKVRKMLCEAFANIDQQPESFGLPITTNYPIKIIENNSEENEDFKFHGWVEGEQKGGWIRQFNKELAKNYSILSLFVQLRSKNGSILPMELLLPTLLHELAHTVTMPEKWRVGSIPQEFRQYEEIDIKKPDEWVILHHSPTFYTNFVILLQMAEKLGIYVLPSIPNKYSARNLKRFDQIQIDSSENGFQNGHSPIFSVRKKGRPLRLILTDGQRTKKKPITLDIERKSVDEILKEAKSRLNMRKKPKNVVTIQGKTVTNDMLENEIENDTIIVIQ